MKRRIKLTSTEQQQEQSAEQQSQQSAPLEFASPEDLLRYDAARTRVPDAIAERLNKSTGGPPPPPRPWWRRIF